ncbi:MAG: hypothetical protein IPF84_05610 [Proteobacteria bacterium]|nr:hypothetical protein [Pseudomonadota bacterium]
MDFQPGPLQRGQSRCGAPCSGSLCLLLRKAWAVWLFGTSIVAMVLTGLYSYVLTDGLALMGTGGAIFTAVIWLIAFSLFFYARAMARCGVLR